MSNLPRRQGINLAKRKYFAKHKLTNMNMIHIFVAKNNELYSIGAELNIQWAIFRVSQRTAGPIFILFFGCIC